MPNYYGIFPEMFNFCCFKNHLPYDSNHHGKPEAVDSYIEVDEMSHDDAAVFADVVWHRIEEQVAGEVEEQNGIEAVVDDRVG